MIMISKKTNKLTLIYKEKQVYIVGMGVTY